MTADSVTAVCALVVSVISLATSIYFGWCTRDHDKRSVTPLPFIEQSDFEDNTYVAVENHGSGPLIVRNVIATHAPSGVSGSLYEIVPEPPQEYAFTNFTEVSAERAILPGQSIELIDAEFDLANPAETEYRDILRKFLSDVTLEVQFTDVYLTNFTPLKQHLEWFRRPI